MCSSQVRCPVDGPRPGTTLEILGNDRVFWENGSDRALDRDTLETFEPRAVKVTTRDGRIFDLDLDLGVTRLEDPNGNSLDITPQGITHSSGEGSGFERDAQGRIVKITSPADLELSYLHDGVGDLISVIDLAGDETHFAYRPSPTGP